MLSIPPSIAKLIPSPLLELMIRFGKIVPIPDITAQLFRDEIKVPSPVPFVAYRTAVRENIYPLQIIKIASLLSASVLNGFKAVIRIRAYPTSPPDRVSWSSCLLDLIGRAPKGSSLDASIRWRFV